MTGTYGSLRGFYCEVDSISSGTFYLIFALFSGLLGTAFSVLVRRLLDNWFVRESQQRSSNTLTTSVLGRRESLLLNLAWLPKTGKVGKQWTTHPWVVVSMVKSALIEVYWEDTSGKGSKLDCNRFSTRTRCMLKRHLVGSFVVQNARSIKTKNGTPKETNGQLSGLRDHLRLYRYNYGDRDFVVGLSSLKGVRMYSSVGIRERSGVRPNELPNKFARLIEVSSSRTKDFKANNIYELMYNERLYEMAYHKLKSKPGNMTPPGLSPTTLDGISLETFRNIIKSMKDDSFNFSPGRRVNIPKSNGGSRPLTIAPPRDKIVQEVMRMILEAIFEPTFLDCSHGFRPSRSCHTALRQVKGQFGAASFLIEGDISKCFPSIDHHVLMNFVGIRISDTRFLQLLWKALRAGYCEFHQIQNSIIGTPQGSIISPILSNVYLHNLDVYAMSLQLRFTKGKLAPTKVGDPKYRKHENLRAKALKMGDTEGAKIQLKLMQKLKSRLPNDPNFRRLYYVRYADDWVMAIRGTRAETNKILEDTRVFLKNELKLDLSETKTLITTPRKRSALFLGTNIRISNHINYVAGERGQRIKTVSQVVLNAPMDRIYRKLAEANLLNLNSMNSKPRFLWLAEDKDQIIKLYNSVLRGYLNYYSFTNNYPKVASSLEWILKNSCAMLLAAKFKLRTVNKVLTKYGKNLKGEGKTSFFKPTYKKNVWDFKFKVATNLATLFATRLSTTSLEDLVCSKCESAVQVEMHHIRKLKDLNPKMSEIDKLMAKRKRKQIPLCRKCHLEHHVKHSSEVEIADHPSSDSTKWILFWGR